MSLHLLPSSKSIDRFRAFTKWQNILTMMLLYVMPFQYHSHLRFLQNKALVKQHFYNGILWSATTPLILLWLLLEGAQLFLHKKVDLKKLLFSIAPLLILFFCLGKHPSLGMFQMYRVAEFMIMLSMFWRFMEIHGAEKTREVFFRSALVIGMIESIAIGLQFFTGKSLGLRYFGEPRFDVNWIKSPFILDVTESLLDIVPFLPPSFIRAPGTTAHPNIIGGILAVYLLMLFCFKIFPKQKNGIKQNKSSPWLVTLFFSALLMTFSRSALFGFGIGFAILGIWMIFHRKINKKVLLFLGGVFLLLSPLMIARGGIFFNSNKVIKECNEERMNMIQTSWKMFTDHPIKGVGSGEYVATVPEYTSHSLKILYEPVHNLLCLILAEMGILGLVCIGLVLRRYFIFKIPKTAMEWGALSSLITLLFISNCDHYLLTSPEGRVLFAIGFSWYALEFHFARQTVFEAVRKKDMPTPVS